MNAKMRGMRAGVSTRRGVVPANAKIDIEIDTMNDKKKSSKSTEFLKENRGCIRSSTPKKNKTAHKTAMHTQKQPLQSSTIQNQISVIPKKSFPKQISTLPRTLQDREHKFYCSFRCKEYTDEIFSHLKYLEHRNSINPNYMTLQSQLDWNMRSILVEWLVQVCLEFRLHDETLHMTISLIDRFLSVKEVAVEKLQLLGVACLFIAAKFEEEKPLPVDDLVKISDNTYTRKEIIKGETFVLQYLKWDLGYAEPLNYLRRISDIDGGDQIIRTLGKYFFELTFAYYYFLQFPVSILCASAMYLAGKVVKGDQWMWRKEHLESTGYTESHIAPLAKDILEATAHPESHDAIFKKFSKTDRYFGVSLEMQKYLKSIRYQKGGKRC